MIHSIKQSNAVVQRAAHFSDDVPSSELVRDGHIKEAIDLVHEQIIFLKDAGKFDDGKDTIALLIQLDENMQKKLIDENIDRKFIS